MASEAFLSKANTMFALDLFKKFREEDKTGNIFYSPFSISAALAMTNLGTGGNTNTQISEVLHFVERAPSLSAEECSQVSQSSGRPYEMLAQSRKQTRNQIQISSRLPPYLRKCLKPQDDKENVDASFAELLGELIKPEALYALSIANRLYGEKTYTFKTDFISDTNKYYGAPFETVDFSTNPNESRDLINNWVKEQTKDKIPELLSSDAVGSSTVLVLVNAIYFKGKWKSQFREEFTRDGVNFQLNKNDTKPVKMMMQKDKFPYSYNEDVKCQILEMPYEGDDLSMIIMLPEGIEDETTGLEKLESELTYGKFKEWTKKEVMEETEVEVRLPRFKMEESYELQEVLMSLGMVDAFDVSKSDFSGMSDANNLVVSKVVHKAFLEVNEEGSEAAAATGVVVIERAALISESFRADHPFLVFIRHNPTNSVLFAGRFSSPE